VARMWVRWGIVFALLGCTACSGPEAAPNKRDRPHRDAQGATDATPGENLQPDASHGVVSPDASRDADHDGQAVDADSAAPAMDAAGLTDSAIVQAGAPAADAHDAGAGHSDDGGTDVPPVCEPGRTSGKLLVVFDRSGSMEELWDTSSKRAVAVELLTRVLAASSLPLRVAGQFFPSPIENGCVCDVSNPDHWIPGPGACCLSETMSSCHVTAIGAADQIDFVSTDEFLSELPVKAAFFQSSTPAANTPLVAALARADEALATIPLAERWAVLLVTDGAPTCSDVFADGLARVAAWRAAGIPTRVVSFAKDAVSMDMAQQLAAAGGSPSVFQPGDATQLRAELGRVLESAACSMGR
jgi:Mg-chelatase subunit ChlD